MEFHPFMLGLLLNLRRKKDFMENFYDILLYQDGVDGDRGPLTSFSHFTNYLKYIFYLRAVCTLYYISTHWDSSCYFSAYLDDQYFVLHFSLLGQSEPFLAM